MSEHASIPPNVAAGDAELLRRAYTLETQEQGAQLYSEWADTYDRTMVDGLGYLSPSMLATIFAERTQWRDEPIVDLGCGTGLVGATLAAAGFTNIDGLDLSHAMMAKAAERGVYGRFIEADLNAILPIADDTYAAAICSGTFTSGHVGAGCLPEVLRIIRPGGTFAASINHAVWSEFGFDSALADLTARGVIEVIDIIESAYYVSSTGTDGRHCVYRKR